MNGAPRVEAKHRFALFWGGGLGDLLAIRPLLMGLAGRLETPPHFFTTAHHLEGLFEALDIRVQLQVLPAAPREALAVFRRLGVHFDWIYLGPYVRLKTRLLAQVVGAERIWSRRYPEADAFIAEQIAADAQALGLVAPSQPYGGSAGLARAPVSVPRDYLVFHPGAKSRWETTRWPLERWRALLQRALAASAAEVVLVGVEPERPMLESLLEGLDAGARGRVHVAADWSLPQLVSGVEASRGVVCHNSGVLHLAAALGKPTLALTGSSARYWRPPYPQVMNLTSGTCGLACNQYRCPVPFYRARCIRELEVDAVMEAARRLLL